MFMAITNNTVQFSLQLQPVNRGIDYTLLLRIEYQFCIIHPLHQLHFLIIFVQQFNSFLQLSFSSFVLVGEIFIDLTLIFVNNFELSCRSCSEHSQSQWWNFTDWPGPFIKPWITFRLLYSLPINWMDSENWQVIPAKSAIRTIFVSFYDTDLK